MTLVFIGCYFGTWLFAGVPALLGQDSRALFYQTFHLLENGLL